MCVLLSTFSAWTGGAAAVGIALGAYAARGQR